MKKIEVGQVWQVGDRLVMVSSVSSRKVLVGKAEKRGATYAIVGTPTPTSIGRLQSGGTFVCDTEA